MKFSDFSKLHQNHINNMTKNVNSLFVVDIDKDVLWNLYLDSFPEGTNEIFRERREYDCSCCKNFVRNFGNVVKITEDNEIVTIWDFNPKDTTFSPVMNALSDFVRSAVIQDVHVTKENKFGTEKNREMTDSGEIIVWNHFYTDIPTCLVHRGSESESVGERTGILRDNRNVFKRSLEEITPEAVQDVLDMIFEKVLYKGDEWKAALSQFQKLQQEYLRLTDDKKRENFTWRVSTQIPGAVAKLRNTSMGTLLQDLSEGVNVDVAVRKYEVVVAPSNYKRPKAIFTKQMIKAAEKTVGELGLEESLGRRHAQLNDITINNVIWANPDAQKHMSGLGGVFDSLMEEIPVNPNQFKNVKGISVDKFVSDILPTANEIDILFENNLQKSLVSLIAPQNPEAKSMFKWSNGFSWSYNGNITDSSIKANVKNAGGKVDGVMRFSLQWNDKDQWNRNDYDAHCEEPMHHIYYARKNSRAGSLDVDIVDPQHNKPAVENIIYPTVNNMDEGLYTFYVHNYSHRGGTDGFDAELEIDGQVFNFQYHKDLRHKGNVIVAKVKYSKTKGFKIIDSLPSAPTVNTKEVWGLKTNQWQRVSSVMFSPNYWDDQICIGHKHMFFMLAGCINPDQPNGFYNEYLSESLMKHKRVFEALGSKMRVEKSENQLSGLGFSSTKRDSLICRVDGKIIKIIF